MAQPNAADMDSLSMTKITDNNVSMIMPEGRLKTAKPMPQMMGNVGLGMSAGSQMPSAINPN